MSEFINQLFDDGYLEVEKKACDGLTYIFKLTLNDELNSHYNYQEFKCSTDLENWIAQLSENLPNYTWRDIILIREDKNNMTFQPWNLQLRIKRVYPKCKVIPDDFWDYSSNLWHND